MNSTVSTPFLSEKTLAISFLADNIVTVRLKPWYPTMNSVSLRNAQSYSYGKENPIVTSNATEALLGKKLSNGITVDGYRGIAETQREPVVSEQTTSQVS
jgi:hypothetical protein